MPLVAGVDSSTQSTKIVVCDAQTGVIIRAGRAAHPEGTEVDPQHWWDAYLAASDGLLEGVEALGVGGQQHGMIAMGEHREVLRPALLWNDVRSAAAARDLVAELGGPEAWARAVGSVPLAAFTVTKLRWLAEHEPNVAKRVADVVLPHDWLTAQLIGLGAPLVTDRGDASGTGYWSPAEGEYRPDVMQKAFGRVVGLPRVLGPAEPAGSTPDGILVSAGTGDNMAAALGLGLEHGDVVVSLGTSGTVFAVHGRPTADPSAEVAGFADATGRFLPLVCTLNAARVLSATATMLGTDLPGLDRLALGAEPGAGGLVLLPYLDGERTPDLPDATGTLSGLRRGSMTPSNVARAAVEGMLCGLADGLAALTRQGVPTQRVLLIGGAAASSSVRAIAPQVFGAPVSLPEPGEYVALGAARQAAWALSGAAEPPKWQVASAEIDVTPDREVGALIRDQYATVRQHVHG